MGPYLSFFRALPLRASVAALAPLAALLLPACMGPGSLQISPFSLQLGGSTPGNDGVATFSYTSFDALSTPLAAGASDGISISVPAGYDVDHVGISDSTIMALGALASSGAEEWTVPVTGGKPGSALLTIYDPSNKVIDQVTVTVAPTTSIPLDVRSGATLLQNCTYAVHATTVGASGTLAGTGAIQFAYGGALASGGSTAFSVCVGDCGFFWTPSTGAGQLTATATSASASLTAQVVPLGAIDSLAFSSTNVQIVSGDAPSLTYTIEAGGTLVYGDGSELSCTSSNPNVAAPTSLGTLGASASGNFVLQSSQTGTATVTCTVGSAQATLTVTSR